MSLKNDQTPKIQESSLICEETFKAEIFADLWSNISIGNWSALPVALVALSYFDWTFDECHQLFIL